jgi:hypothetical protein
MALVKWVGGLVLGLGIAGYGHYADVQDTKMVLAKYNFSEVEKTRFKICHSAMASSDVSFDDTTNAGGCGCIVTSIRDSFAEQDRNMAHELDALDSWTMGTNATEQGYQTRLKAISVKYSQLIIN